MRAWFSVVLVLGWVACGNRDREQPPRPSATPSATPPAPAPAPAPGCERPGGTVCVDDEVVECLADGSLGKRVERCDGGCTAGACVVTCGVRDVELVYVVDNENNLSSFDPRKLPSDPFRPVAKLACERTETPFSMGVDRMGIAWVLYRSGTLYRVSIIDGKCLQGRTPTGAPALFGMGFVSDGPKADTEKLFVAEYQGTALAHLDVTQKEPPWHPRGDLRGGKNPELSGTGAGKLYGFFPDGGGIVQEIDPATAQLRGTPMRVGAPAGQIGGWAFAHWGGNFYVFVTIDDNSMVFEIDGKTRRSKRVLENLPHVIVGAGASTCAPLLESVPP